MKVKFYDQKLKLGRKLFFVVVVGWMLWVVTGACLFLLFLKGSQPWGSALGAFWGVCSKQVLAGGSCALGRARGWVLASITALVTFRQAGFCVFLPFFTLKVVLLVVHEFLPPLLKK